MKLYRHQHNWTQQDVADRLLISRKTISSWENSRSYPDIFMLVQISDLYHISLDDLLREDHEMIDNYKEEHLVKTRKDRIFSILYVINVLGCLYFVMQSLGYLKFISILGVNLKMGNGILLGLFSINALLLILYGDWKKVNVTIKTEIIVTLVVITILLMKLDSITFSVGSNDLKDFITGFLVSMKSIALTILIWLYPQFRKRERIGS